MIYVDKRAEMIWIYLVKNERLPRQPLHSTVAAARLKRYQRTPCILGLHTFAPADEAKMLFQKLDIFLNLKMVSYSLLCQFNTHIVPGIRSTKRMDEQIMA